MDAEAFLSASIQRLRDKLASAEFMDLFRGLKLDHSLLEELKLTFLTLDAVLDDAEEKQIENYAVRAWLRELRHAVFDAEDLVDEIDAEGLCRKVEAEYQTKKTHVWNFLFDSLSPSYRGVNARIQKTSERLDFLAKQKDVLSLKERAVRGSVSSQSPTTPLVVEDIFGRDEDKEELKTLLLSDDASSGDISVIPIVGMGGVGKTTLAELLYNDEKIKEYFDVKAWAPVSEDFDAFRVTKNLFGSITSEPCEILDMSLLQVELREQVRGKKFLFVLDDLWNENSNDWDLVRAPFTYGTRGSKVIVTTRYAKVASTVHTVPIHYLKPLSDKDCWLLLAKHAFRNENSRVHPDLEEIGKQIAHKCNGHPLAAKALGSLLGCKVGYKEWSHILNNNLWMRSYNFDLEQKTFEIIDHLAKQKDVLGLEVVRGNVSPRTPTARSAEDIYGRDEDKEKLKTLLLTDDASSGDISVIPIVGMDGVGKTTLAQLLYNDNGVKEYFDVRAFVHVSQDFDPVRVTKTLLESIASKPVGNLDMILLQEELREQIRGKKFLFVLDDLRNGNYNDWKFLQAHFTYGARGSRVIVTTRSTIVASLVHTVSIYDLQQLSEEYCWYVTCKTCIRK